MEYVEEQRMHAIVLKIAIQISITILEHSVILQKNNIN